MIKKTAVLLSVILSIFLQCACTPTPTASPVAEEPLNIYTLSKYTIVYPESYTEYQKEAVYVLRDAIKKLTGVQIPVITDSQPYTDNEIILASSKRVTSLKQTIESLEGPMDYIIALSNEDIILGGKSFYSDIRALYDFVNNYIGYDDVSNKLIAGDKSLIGISKNTYTEPTFTINSINYEAEPFLNVAHIQALKNAGFNTVTVDAHMYTEKQLYEFVTQCTRFGLQIIFRGLEHVDIYRDCPVIKGHCIVDEPYGDEAYQYYSELCSEYSEAYAQYGWQPYVNLMGQLDVIKYIAGSAYFSDVKTVAFYSKLFGTAKNTDYIFREYEVLAQKAHLEGKQLWGYVQADDLESIDPSKAFRWMTVVAMCFGAQGIQYFSYASSAENNSDKAYDSPIGNANLSSSAYAAATNVNENLMSLVSLYRNYTYLGTYTIQGCDAPEYTLLDKPYSGFDDKLTDFTCENDSCSFIVGCFRSNNFDGGYAAMIMDAAIPNDITYGSDIGNTIKFKLNSSLASVFCYVDGDELTLEADADGYFSITLQNSQPLFVTFK